MHTRIHTPKHKHTQNVHKTQKSYNIRKSLIIFLILQTARCTHTNICTLALVRAHTHAHFDHSYGNIRKLTSTRKYTCTSSTRI